MHFFNHGLHALPPLNTSSSHLHGNTFDFPLLIFSSCYPFPQAHSIRRHSSFDTSSPLSRSASNGSFRERLFSIRKPSVPEDMNSYNVSAKLLTRKLLTLKLLTRIEIEHFQYRAPTSVVPWGTVKNFICFRINRVVLTTLLHKNTVVAEDCFRDVSPGKTVSKTEWHGLHFFFIKTLKSPPLRFVILDVFCCGCSLFFCNNPYR